MIEINNLVKRYGNLVALDHLNLTIHEGEIFGLLGPNGSGKTTAINCMLALLKYDKGTIRIFGEEMRPDNYKIKQQIGIVLQNVAVFDELTVYENIDYFCGLYVKDKTKRKPLVKEAIEFVGLEEFTKLRPKKLSGGLLRRLNIACGIAHKPKLIILDEPTAGQDFKHYTEIMEFLRKLNERGVTVVMITHDMHLMLEYTPRALVFSDGQLIADRRASEVLCDPELIERAALKETSLFTLANHCAITPPEAFVERFIGEDREVRSHGC